MNYDIPFSDNYVCRTGDTRVGRVVCQSGYPSGRGSQATRVSRCCQSGRPLGSPDHTRHDSTCLSLNFRSLLPTHGPEMEAAVAQHATLRRHLAVPIAGTPSTRGRVPDVVVPATSRPWSAAGAEWLFVPAKFRGFGVADTSATCTRNSICSP